jgi:hypothetical protein
MICDGKKSELEDEITQAILLSASTSRVGTELNISRNFRFNLFTLQVRTQYPSLSVLQDIRHPVVFCQVTIL